MSARSGVGQVNFRAEAQGGAIKKTKQHEEASAAMPTTEATGFNDGKRGASSGDPEISSSDRHTPTVIGTTYEFPGRRASFA